jgi:hypothetical protein
MIIRYFPSDKVVIDEVVLKFNEERNKIRVKLSKNYRENNRIIQAGDSDSEPIFV